MKKIFVFFATFIFFCLFPLDVRADEEITNAYAYLEPPKINNSAYSNNYSQADYTVITDWYNVTDNIKMNDGDQFEKNKEYELNFKITANEGYTISRNIYIDYGNATQSDFYVETGEPQITNNTYQTVIRYNTTLEKYKIYDDIYLSNSDLKIGEKPVYTDITYSKLNVTQQWYNVTDDKIMTDNDTFERNKKYEYIITIVPKSKYKISRYISVWGNFYNSYMEEYYEKEILSNTEKEYKVKYRYDTSQENSVIKDPLEVDLSNFKPGVKTIFVSSDDPRYTIEQSWTEIDSGGDEIRQLTDTDTFEKNKYYRYDVRVIPKDGYTLSNHYQIDFSKTENIGYFKEIWSNSWYDFGTITVDTFDKEIENIYNLNTYGVYPHIGEKLSFVTEYETDYDHGYTIKSQSWYNVTDNKQMNTDDVFENGKTYRFNIRIDAKQGRKFADEIFSDLIYLEDSDFYIENGSGTSLDDYTYEVSYMFKMQKQPNIVYGPVNLDVITPIIGGKVTNLPEYEGLIITETWYNATDKRELTSNDYFEANKIYEYSVRTKLKPGYSYSNDFYFKKTSDKYTYGGGGMPSDDGFVKYIEFITSDDIENENLIIGEIPIDIKSPIIGKKQPYLTSCLFDCDIDQSWVEIDSNKNEIKTLEDNDVFEKNKLYRYKLTITPTNKKFSENVTIPSFDSVENTPYYDDLNYTLNKDKLDVIVDFDTSTSEERIINEITINDLTNVRSGQNIEYSNSDNSKIDIVQKWFKIEDNGTETRLNTSDVYESDKVYRYSIEITPKAGYYLAPNFKVNIENVPIDTNYKYFDNGTYYYEAYITISDSIKKTPKVSIESEYYTDDGHLNIPFGIDTVSIDVSSTPNNWHVETNDYNTFTTTRNNNKIVISDLDLADITWTSNFSIIFDETEEYKEYTYYISFNIVKAPVINPTLSGYEGNYDGKSHTITSTGGEGGDIVYSTDSTNWSSEIPTATETGTTKVYAKVIPDEFHFGISPVSANIVINEPTGPIANDIVISAKQLTYNSNSQQLVEVSKNDTVYYSLENELTSSNYMEGSTQIPKATDAGEYDIYYYIPANQNYTELKGSLRSIIQKADAINPNVRGYNGNYDGNPHTVTVTGGEGGVIEYSIDNQNWSTSKPEFTEIGENTIYIRINPDKNHNAVEQQSVKITIRDPEEFLKGDANDDGKLSLLDVRLALQKFLNSDYTDREKTLIDYNEDGNVTLLDTRLLLQAILNG